MTQGPALARPIGLLHATAVVVGIIIGTSIFVQPSETNRHVSGIPAVLLVWVAAGLLTLSGALACAELCCYISTMRYSAYTCSWRLLSCFACSSSK